MAECSVADLQEQACASEFIQAAANPVLARALELQLLYLISGSTATLAELQAEACSNKFMQIAADPVKADAIRLQLLCNISGGT